MKQVAAASQAASGDCHSSDSKLKFGNTVAGAVLGTTHHMVEAAVQSPLGSEKHVKLICCTVQRGVREVCRVGLRCVCALILACAAHLH